MNRLAEFDELGFGGFIERFGYGPRTEKLLGGQYDRAQAASPESVASRGEVNEISDAERIANVYQDRAEYGYPGMKAENEKSAQSALQRLTELLGKYGS